MIEGTASTEPQRAAMVLQTDLAGLLVAMQLAMHCFDQRHPSNFQLIHMQLVSLYQQLVSCYQSNNA